MEHAAGLVKHDDVNIAGVKAGVLEKVGVDHDRALLILRVDPDVVLHDDCVAIVRAKRESLLEELRQLVEDSLATVAALRRIAERNDEGISKLE